MADSVKMPRRNERIEILGAQRGDVVEATLRLGLTKVELVKTEIAWAPVRAEALDRLLQEGRTVEELPQHPHWNWRDKSTLLSDVKYGCIGIENAHGMQGLMLVDLSSWGARLEPDMGKPLLYIQYLEVAPWNTAALTPTPRYRFVGTGLFSAAVRLSREMGYNGRVGLHSLPQAEGFYRTACNMRYVAHDPAVEALAYFELAASDAGKERDNE